MHELQQEMEASEAKKERDELEAIANIPFFSKLGYMLTFGEPVAEGNVHAGDDSWRQKMLLREHWWVIHPYSVFRRYWDVFLMVLLLYVALLVPFVIGFEVNTDPETPIFALDRLVDGFFILDIAFNFFTGFTALGKVVLDPYSIAREYLGSWFALDVLASIPFDLIATALSDAATSSSTAAYRSTKFVRITKLFRLVKLFRMLRLNRILNRLERKLSIKYGLWQVIKFAFVVLCLAHWMACSWYLVHILQNKGDGGSTWVEVLARDNNYGASLDSQGRWTQYVTCVYWAITTMTTIGYGDIIPSNTIERIITLICELMGSSVFLYGLTQVTSLIANSNSADVEFHRLMDQANEYFEFRLIPIPLRAKVREFFHYKRASSLFHAEHKLLDHLSDNIRQEVQLWSMRKVLNQTPFLRDANEGFLKLIVDKLVRKVYSPKEIVIQQGEIGDEMYFIAHGEVEVLAGGHRVAYLGEGAMIGEIAMAMKTRRTATVRTVTFTELLSLSRRTFQHAAQRVPETADAMLGFAVKRLRIALWKRVKTQVLLIGCANTIKVAAGMGRLSTGFGSSRRSTNALHSLGSGARASQQQGMGLMAGSGGTAAGRISRGSGHASFNGGGSVLAPTAFFNAGLDATPLPMLENEGQTKAKCKYLLEEISFATSLMSVATFATQLMQSRLNGNSTDPETAPSLEAECDVTTDELLSLLGRVQAQIENASERIQTSRVRIARRSTTGVAYTNNDKN